MRCMYAGNNVFTLRIDQILTVKHFFAGSRIAGESNASRAGVAPVAEHHRLHVDSSAPFVGNSILAPINYGAVIVPGTEHCSDRSPELLAWILRKVFSGTLLDQLFKSGDQGLEMFDSQISIVFSTGLFLN